MGHFHSLKFWNGVELDFQFIWKQYWSLWRGKGGIFVLLKERRNFFLSIIWGSHVTCCVSRVMCHVSYVTCPFFSSSFFGQSGEAYWWRVSYQRGLPRLVSKYINGTMRLNCQLFSVSNVHGDLAIQNSWPPPKKFWTPKLFSSVPPLHFSLFIAMVILSASVKRSSVSLMWDFLGKLEEKEIMFFFLYLKCVWLCCICRRFYIALNALNMNIT